jgi:hypothetical protein
MQLIEAVLDVGTLGQALEVGLVVVVAHPILVIGLVPSRAWAIEHMGNNLVYHVETPADAKNLQIPI